MRFIKYCVFLLLSFTMLLFVTSNLNATTSDLDLNTDSLNDQKDVINHKSVDNSQLFTTRFKLKEKVTKKNEKKNEILLKNKSITTSKIFDKYDGVKDKLFNTVVISDSVAKSNESELNFTIICFSIFASLVVVVLTISRYRKKEKSYENKY